MCPNGFIPHGEYGELGLDNHKVGTWQNVSTIEKCAEECNNVGCRAFEYNSESNFCAPYSVAVKQPSPNPQGWVSCIKEGN